MGFVSPHSRQINHKNPTHDKLRTHAKNMHTPKNEKKKEICFAFTENEVGVNEIKKMGNSNRNESIINIFLG